MQGSLPASLIVDAKDSRRSSKELWQVSPLELYGPSKTLSAVLAQGHLVTQILHLIPSSMRGGQLRHLHMTWRGTGNLIPRSWHLCGSWALDAVCPLKEAVRPAVSIVVSGVPTSIDCTVGIIPKGKLEKSRTLFICTQNPLSNQCLEFFLNMK